MYPMTYILSTYIEIWIRNLPVLLHFPGFASSPKDLQLKTDMGWDDPEGGEIHEFGQGASRYDVL